jgi:hypothetical protein
MRRTRTSVVAISASLLLTPLWDCRLPGYKKVTSGLGGKDVEIELAQSAEEGDGVGVAETESGGPAPGFTGGHDEVFEDAGGRCAALALAFDPEQAVVDVATSFDQEGQVLEAERGERLGVPGPQSGSRRRLRCCYDGPLTPRV